MAFAVGDKVVVNNLPGEIVQVITVGTVTTYEVEYQQPAIRWFNPTQLTLGGTTNPGDQVLVGTIPGLIVQVWPGGPYPLYLVSLIQPVDGWFLPSSINPPLPPAPQPAGAAPAVRPR
jgi:hypothetical protein